LIGAVWLVTLFLTLVIVISKLYDSTGASSCFVGLAKLYFRGGAFSINGYDQLTVLLQLNLPLLYPFTFSQQASSSREL
jgi:hypothetical protein